MLLLKLEFLFGKNFSETLSSFYLVFVISWFPGSYQFQRSLNSALAECGHRHMTSSLSELQTRTTIQTVQQRRSASLAEMLAASRVASRSDIAT